ncbi:MAG: twin-arginine translocase subunit TatC [Acidimicrobiales bacterium]
MRRQGSSQPNPDTMTLFEHLAELRRRLIVCIVGFMAGGLATYVAYNPILTALRAPYCTALISLHQNSHSCKFFITAPLEGFTTRLNVSAYGGIILALPLILYELWQFVNPGLKARERKYSLPFVLASVLLFSVGGLVAYFIYPRALQFLIGSSGPHVTSIFSPATYLSLLGALVLIFGLAFEFPVVLVALELAGAITSKSLRSFRRWAILLIVIFAAVITPSSDPFSMLALAIPLLFFYEAAILVGRLLRK